jgi:hypothetical protein
MHEPLYTIGHSIHGAGDLVGLLDQTCRMRDFPPGGSVTFSGRWHAHRRYIGPS